jgi:cytoskeleton protein RodZ
MVASPTAAPRRGNHVLGDSLRQAREARNLSLATVAKSLNIPQAKLQALEEGDFSVFAAEVYARGAYLQYAAYVGLDEQTCQREILRALASVRQVQPLKVYTPYTWLQRLVFPRLIIFSFMTLIAVLVGGYIAWQIQSYFHLPKLALTLPAHEVTQDADVVVEGKSDPETKVTVNNQQVLLRPDATFGIKLHLHAGINIVRVEAENAAGRKRIIEHPLLLSRS